MNAVATAGLAVDPLLPLWLLGALAALAAVGAMAALRGRLAGAWARILGLVCILVALLNPTLREETRQPLDDVVLAVIDRSSSQRLGARTAQSDAALSALRQWVQTAGGADLRVVEVPDAQGPGGGTRLAEPLATALGRIPPDRLAGVVIASDGLVQDADALPEVPAPVHLLLTGNADDWDRRIVVHNAPTFGILGEPARLVVSVEDEGAAPPPPDEGVLVRLSVDVAPAREFRLPIGRPVEIPFELDHGGRNLVRLEVAPAPGELSHANNSALIDVNGVRDRLRVLLVSGAPHVGERTWRNLLKSDSAVDLVHFTILRPPEKHDGVPVDELSLIAFPTRELFIDKIDEFDLIIFDRYRLRGILPNIYLDNVRRYVEDGGAVLVTAGPDFASAASLARSPLGDVLPMRPTGRVIEKGFRPRVTELGRRHPVTEALEALAPARPRADGAPGWGRWFRQIEIAPADRQASPAAGAAQTVMSGVDDKPLLVLQRVGKGRVALLASDHAWLWHRGFEGGGPQLELLRRLAHWTMKEPRLEEEALWAEARPGGLTIWRRTMGDTAADVTLTGPDGTTRTATPAPRGPGRFAVDVDGLPDGIYALDDGTLRAVAAVGAATPVEFERTVATDEPLSAWVAQSGGATLRLEDGMPKLRFVRAGAPVSGRGWLGLLRRGAHVTAELRVTPLAPAWLYLVLAAGLYLSGWLIEGRREGGRSPRR